MKIGSYLRVGFNTTLNIILYAATTGKYLWLEGRVGGGIFRNWARRFRYTPIMYAEPSSEQEIVEIVRDCAKARVFGSGHSFNEGNVSDEVLISLDNYSGLVSKDPANRQITVRGGTRVRDVVKLLAKDGLAFAALPSHDAQSIAGILSTDVHGTGRDWGFVSSSVVRLKLLDGNGDLIMCEPADDLFRAVIGGIGAVGIILEVTVQAVPRFNIDQRVDICDLDEVRRSLDTLIATNDHFSLYLFPFTNQCQVNTWNFSRVRPVHAADTTKNSSRTHAAGQLIKELGGRYRFQAVSIPRLSYTPPSVRVSSSLNSGPTKSFPGSVRHSSSLRSIVQGDSIGGKAEDAATATATGRSGSMTRPTR